MDWISVVTGCVVANNAITKALLSLQAFVREVRNSRSELEIISGELHSLGGVLDLLNNDATTIAPDLAGPTSLVLEQCAVVVSQIDEHFSALNGSGSSPQEKRSRWMKTRKDIDKLRASLNMCKSALGLGLDVIALAASNSGNGRIVLKKAARNGQDSDTQHEVSRLSAELGHLRARLQMEFSGDCAVSSLRGYLDAVQSAADDAAAASIAAYPARLRRAASFGGEAPARGLRINSAPPLLDVSIPIGEIDDLIDELREMSGRPPTPPPKALARMNPVRDSVLQPPERRLRTSESESGLIYKTASSDSGPGASVDTASSGGSAVSPTAIDLKTGQGVYAVVTKSSFDGQSVSPVKRSRMGRLIGHVRNALSEDTREPEVTSVYPPAAGEQVGFVRRRSRQLSISFRRAPKQMDTTEENAEPDAVFGVSLNKSIQTAKGAAKTHHAGSGSSRREFPLCILKCCSFLKEEGIETPDLFGEASDLDSLQRLKDEFSTAPTYGEDLDWADYSVYEAADLILLYLSHLPKPLISASVAKRWISLSKQATVAGSLAIRLEQCIDFWEEALSGVREPARSLFKLLLNLWGDIADAADMNDMTAERLAGRVLKPLMHTPMGTYDTDYMLGLAFLIRKRSEYSMLLQGNTRKSKAAF